MMIQTTPETNGNHSAIHVLAETELEAVTGGGIFSIARDAFYGAIGYGNLANIAHAYAAGLIAGAR